MIQWMDIEKIHVVRRLRQLIGNWWKIQINFTDEKGFIRGVPQGQFFNPINPVCQAITKAESGFKGCIDTVRKTAFIGKKNKGSQLDRCHAGFSTITVPIKIEGEYQGCVFGDGFLLTETSEEQKRIVKYALKSQFPTNAELEHHVESLPILSQKEVEYLTELIEMVVEEIVVIHTNLSHAENEVAQLRSELGSRFRFQNMIGKSPAMQELYSLVERICDSSALVLIQGENGTGKELIARALHYNSKRAKKKFMVVNCGAFNENLLESELFGHTKGAFTGAVKDKIGLFEAAEDGTVFLDEIGDTSPMMQVKLLRVLQSGEYTPVGSTTVKHSNARVVCATNKNIEEMVKKREFREDLYYRLNVINIRVPTLAERKEDIPLLVEQFLKDYKQSSGAPLKSVNEECLRVMLNYNWPGNVRELQNELERLCVLAGDNAILSKDHFSPRILSGVAANGTLVEFSKAGSLKEATENLERAMIVEGLKRTGGNKSKLAKELGISRAGLILKVERYGLNQAS